MPILRAPCHSDSVRLVRRGGLIINRYATQYGPARASRLDSDGRAIDVYIVYNLYNVTLNASIFTDYSAACALVSEYLYNVTVPARQSEVRRSSHAVRKDKSESFRYNTLSGL